MSESSLMPALLHAWASEEYGTSRLMLLAVTPRRHPEV
jgi:hypothetical protein